MEPYTRRLLWAVVLGNIAGLHSSLSKDDFQFGVICDDRTWMNVACGNQSRMNQAGRFDMHVEGILSKNQIPRSRFVV